MTAGIGESLRVGEHRCEITFRFCIPRLSACGGVEMGDRLVGSFQVGEIYCKGAMRLRIRGAQPQGLLKIGHGLRGALSIHGNGAETLVDARIVRLQAASLLNQALGRVKALVLDFKQGELGDGVYVGRIQSSRQAELGRCGIVRRAGGKQKLTE